MPFPLPDDSTDIGDIVLGARTRTCELRLAGERHETAEVLIGEG